MAIKTGTINNDTLTGTIESDALSGLEGNDILYGLAGTDTLYGGNGNDILRGGLGADTLTGGDGNDTYGVDNSSDVVTETNTSATEIDTVQSSIHYTLGANLENLHLLGTGNLNGTGNSLNNVLYANNGNNILDGGAGTDTASYLYATTSVTVSLASTIAQATGGSGSDTLLNIENLIGSRYADILTGNTGNNALNGGYGNDRLFGGAGDDRLYGGAGNDTLRGGLGQDTLTGGTGNDTFKYTSLAEIGSGAYSDRIVDLTPGDTIDLSAIAGLTFNRSGFTSGVTNQVSSYDRYGTGLLIDTDGDQSADYALKLSDSYWIEETAPDSRIYRIMASQTLTGTSGDDTLTGGGADDTLYGGSGNDNLSGRDGDDLLDGGAGNDTLDGGTGSDRLYGGDGNDTLIGGGGRYWDASYDYPSSWLDRNKLYGGAGNDTFKFDMLAKSGGDYATVQGTLDNLLTPPVEIADLAVGDKIDLSAIAGLTFAGVGQGFTGVANQVSVFFPRTGSPDGEMKTILSIDTDGDKHADRDLVLAGNLIIEETAPDSRIYQVAPDRTLTGTAGNNTLAGGNGHDTLYGWDGNDTLSGGYGEDTLYGGQGDDTLYGGLGRDTLYGSDGNDTLIAGNVTLPFDYTDKGLYGGNGNDTLIGGNGFDVLDGGDGNDTLRGGLSPDWLTGGAGNDTFKFASLAEIGSGDRSDLITDYLTMGDKIDLSAIPGLTFAGVGNDFTGAANQVSVKKTDSMRTDLYIDADGNKSADYTLKLAGDMIIEETAPGSGIYQVAPNRTLIGTAGDDNLVGDNGHDTLKGWAGNDILSGGCGDDTLYGGAGNDTFRFASLAEIGNGHYNSSTSQTYDTVADFASGDKIDLSGVDANTNLAGNQVFTFIDAGAFTGVAGQLRYLDGFNFILGDVNGDSTSDFIIQVTGSPTLTATDFVL